MNFLKAQKLLKEFKGGIQLPFTFAMSGTSEPLHLYLKANAAGSGHEAKIKSLPFNTLGQALCIPPLPGEKEVFLLCPWDFSGAVDWRSGVLKNGANVNDLLEQAREVLGLLSSRQDVSIIYLPAALPPIFKSASHAAAFESFLMSELSLMNAKILRKEFFSLASFFYSGCPIAGEYLGQVADIVLNNILLRQMTPKKLLVSDLDNVMWRGVVAEDGPHALEFGPTGGGYQHFVYQTFLKRLMNEGTLLACVSRNDPDTAYQPFELSGMSVGKDDFVAIMASYSAKSAQIKVLAAELNLGLHDIVFVDDNPVEIKEVTEALPSVQCRTFPESASDFSSFITELASLFEKETVTQEDYNRTKLYRLRTTGIAPVKAKGSDLTDYLATLEMKLEICDRSTGDRMRAVQLINKTNQFNLNGRRWSDEDINAVLNEGGQLYTATLVDKNGSHGEILACLLDSRAVVKSWVISCRVFQRFVEYAFFYWLFRNVQPTGFEFLKSVRNEPAQQFFSQSAFNQQNNGLLIVNKEELNLSKKKVQRVVSIEV